MRKIALVTDSSSELSQLDAQRLGIFVLPNHLVFENKSYLDGVNISVMTAEFYLSQGVEMQTLPATMQQFSELFEKLLADYDEILCVLISRKLSQNISNAQQAAQSLGQQHRVTVHDSRMTTVGLGRLVLRAKQLLDTGADVPTVLRQLERLQESMVADTVIPSLKRLKSDRMSVVRAAFASVLKYSPVITFAPDGSLKFAQAVRDRDALNLLLRTIRNRYGQEPLAVTIGVAGSADEQIDRMQRALAASSLNVAYVSSRNIGPTISAHSGLGVYGYVVEPYVEDLLV